MAKQKKKTSKTSKRKSKKKTSYFYLWGTVILLVMIGFGIYQNSTDELAATIHNYILNKQELKDLLGPVEKIEYVSKPFFPDKSKQYNLAVNLKGKNTSGKLKLLATFKENNWFLSETTLVTKNKSTRLGPAFVTKTLMFGGSLSSPPLKSADFIRGEEAYIKVFLSGMEILPDSKITESFSIYNENNLLVITKPEMAVFDASKSKPENNTVGFSNKISDLRPGLYYAQFVFTDQNKKNLETYWQSFSVHESKNSLLVRSIKYFLDKEMKQNVTPEFEANQDIYLRMNLDGFTTSQSKIAGFVDLEITNSGGDVVAHKPRFASFNQDYDAEKSIVVDGRLTLKIPDVYFLSFRIRDFFSKQDITHKEKIIIHLADRLGKKDSSEKISN